MKVGTFKAAVNYNVRHNPNGIAVGDFNEDGYPDITVPNGSAGTTIYVLINRGDGTFFTRYNFWRGQLSL
ncbi:MAG: FG-GAP repeat protein [Candidatus Midichloria sp.]|nr:FG-GAP repeat protein [Candidatus Midichloria sp.]